MTHLSVIVPVFNEEKTVVSILAKLAACRDVHQVVIVDDGSTDRSAKLISKFLATQSKSKYVFLRQENQGKGSAIRVALTKVTGDYVLIQDADLEYDPEEIPKLVAPIKKKRVTAVFGSRFAGEHSNLLFWHRVGNHLLNLWVNILFNTTLSDMETCYKLLPTSLLKKIDLQSKGFEIEPEITCKILKEGINIYEVPISYVGRGFSEGKKITWRDGLLAFGIIFKEWIWR